MKAIKENFETSMTTFFGKSIAEMSYPELRREREIQIWFAKRMERISSYVEYDVSQREHIREDFKPFIEELDAQYDRGEITQRYYWQKKGAYTKKLIALERNEQKAIYTRMLEFEHRAYLALLDEKLAVTPKPRRTKHKPRASIYRRNRVKKYRRKYRKGTEERWNKYREVRLAYLRWQARQEKLSLGELWNQDAFRSVCADRGFTSDIMIQQMISFETDCTMIQAKYMLEHGCFTWLQIMLIGAALQVTPREFAEIFLNGYFVEIGNDMFQATYDKIPKEAINESEDDESSEDS